jgi:oligopeptide transport system permease protein
MTDILIDEPILPVGIKGRSLWEDARRRLLRNPAAVISLYVVAILVLIALAGPFLWVHSADTIYADRVAIAPTFEHMHLLGTDTTGRDMVARLMFGLGISLLVGLAATIVALTIGVAYGAIAGFFGGWLDDVMMRVVDVLYAIPFIFFVIVLMTVVQFNEPLLNLVLIFMAIGAVEWLTTPIQIVFRHIVPNVLGPVVIFATLNVPVIILAESFLSFIGLGVQEPLASLGSLISGGAQQMLVAPWLLVAPALLMLIALLALNFLGDGLRDALDPKER